MSFFGRIQSVQQFVNILSQGGVKGLQNFVDGLNNATKANLTAQRAQASLQRMGLTRLSASISNAMLSIVRPLNTPATAIENHLVAPASNALARHRTLTAVGEGLVAGAVGARLLSGTALGRTLRFNKIPGIGKTAAAGVMAVEAANVASGSTAPDGSMANPFWVIVSPYSSQLNQSGGSVTSGGGGNATSGGGGWGSFFKKIPKIIPFAAAGTMTGLAALGSAIPFIMGGDQGKTVMHYGSGLRKPFKLTDNQTWQQIITKSGMSKPQYDALHAAIAKIGSYPANSTVTFQGNAKADLTIRLVDKNGNQILVTEKKGVPIGITKDTMPQTQGRPGVKTGK